MSRRISYEAGEFDEKINELAFSDNAESHNEAAARLKKIMAKVINEDLTERQREIIILYYYKKYGICEIAEALGVVPSTVSRTIKRARDRIYRCLKYYFV